MVEDQLSFLLWPCFVSHYLSQVFSSKVCSVPVFRLCNPKAAAHAVVDLGHCKAVIIINSKSQVLLAFQSRKCFDTKLKQCKYKNDVKD